MQRNAEKIGISLWGLTQEPKVITDNKKDALTTEHCRVMCIMQYIHTKGIHFNLATKKIMDAIPLV